MATTYVLSTVYQGQRYDVDYWPDGNGTKYHGYATSFRQFKQEIAENCGSSKLTFYIVTKNGQAKSITSDYQLKRAVQGLDDGDVLGITAYKHGFRYYDQTTTTTTTVSSDTSDSICSLSVEATSEYDTTEYDCSQVSLNKKAIYKRFVHSNNECYHCERTNWSGMGYVYHSSTAYSLCDSCYGRLSRSDKRSWVRCGLPWDDDVPCYPLYARSDCAFQDEVRHLQYLLTMLGYMSLKATSIQTGSYQSRTQEAVRRFRQHYHLCGRDMTVYDKKTASKLAQVVRQRRREGRMHF